MTPETNDDLPQAEPRDPDDLPLERDFADVLGPVRRLGEALDGVRFPGRAWPVYRAARRPRILRLLAASAAAAAVLLAIATAYWLGARSRDGAGAGRQKQIAAARPAAKAKSPSPARPVETRIDPSIASYVTLTVPSVSMPSTVDANGLRLRWYVPAMSFPTFETAPAAAKPKTASQPKST